MPKLLWVSPYNLHDSSSGAALHCRKILEQLAKRGVEIVVVGGFIFDNFNGAKSNFPKIEEEVQTDAMKKKPFQVSQNGIRYVYVPTSTTSISQLNHDEELRIYMVFVKTLNQFMPDVCMGYGMGLFGISVHSECKRREIPFVYPICNGNHPYYNFFDCDALFTDSQSNANLYAKRDRLNLATTGCFIDKKDYIDAGGGEHKFITMINPLPEKGGSIFAKIALMAQKDPVLQNEKFLVVNSRGNFSATITQLHDGENKDAKNYQAEMFSNVQMAQNTKQMNKIYAMTKLLIAPSIPKACYEGWGRVASEAVLNRIPVLVANNGGLVEAMAGAGISLDVPQTLWNDPSRMPSDEEIAPWINAVKELLQAKNSNNKAMTFDQWRDSETPEWREKFDNAEKLLDIERSTDRVMEILNPLFAKKASQNPHIMIKGMFRFDKDGNAY